VKDSLSKGPDSEPTFYHSDRIVKVGSTQVVTSYLPNYQFAGSYINDFHEYLGNCKMNGSIIDIGVPGWLRKQDALKLYELGYFAHGDILEFGTNRGLSAYILAKAIIASGRDAKLVTMELSSELSQVSKDNLRRENVVDQVEFRVGDANATCLRLLEEGRRFGMAFVDHSHAYEHVASACRRVNELLTVGSFCVFHDYADSRNSGRRGVGESPEEYGVIAGIEDELDPLFFDFIGTYGCCGVFRKVK
jgi:cephalosporin hydroxylase